MSKLFGAFNLRIAKKFWSFLTLMAKKNLILYRLLALLGSGSTCSGTPKVHVQSITKVKFRRPLVVIGHNRSKIGYKIQKPYLDAI